MNELSTSRLVRQMVLARDLFGNSAVAARYLLLAFGADRVLQAIAEARQSDRGAS